MFKKFKGDTLTIERTFLIGKVQNESTEKGLKIWSESYVD